MYILYMCLSLYIYMHVCANCCWHCYAHHYYHYSESCYHYYRLLPIAYFREACEGGGLRGIMDSLEGFEKELRMRHFSAASTDKNVIDAGAAAPDDAAVVAKLLAICNGQQGVYTYRILHIKDYLVHML